MNKFINDDCIEYLKNIKENTIDMIFTDPPYKLISGGMTNKPWAKGWEKNMSTKNGINYDVPLPSNYLNLFFKILKDDNYCFIMSNDRNIEVFLKEAKKVGFKLCIILVMHKPNKTPNPYFMKNIEFIIMFRKGKYKKSKNSGIGCILKSKRIKNKIHFSQKDPLFIEKLIESCSNKNDLICDPFAGSGSTCIACINTKRNFLAIEKNKNYYDKAKLRINNYLKLNGGDFTT
jgi:site-specific DNA-methyltransferase (adenine-specific)